MLVVVFDCFLLYFYSLDHLTLGKLEVLKPGLDSRFGTCLSTD